MHPEDKHVFPTPVGMNRKQKQAAGPHQCVPHARGDEPMIERAANAAVRCSPRPWG